MQKSNVPTLVQSALRNTRIAGVLPNPWAVAAHCHVNLLQGKKKSRSNFKNACVSKFYTSPLLFTLSPSSCREHHSHQSVRAPLGSACVRAVRERVCAQGVCGRQDEELRLHTHQPVGTESCAPVLINDLKLR